MNHAQSAEGGFVTLLLLSLLVPLVLVAGTFVTVMNSRTTQLNGELGRERALQAAESGVDYAIFRGRVGALRDGSKFERDLGAGMGFTAEVTYLQSDRIDNDDDKDVDEADEDVFQVIVVGTYRNARRRLAAYLGPVGLLPRIDTAAAIHDTSISIDLRGTPLISGFDRNIDGSPGGVDVPAMSIARPASSTTLLAELDLSEQSKVVGPGGPPSLGETDPIDLATLVPQLQNSADLVLTSNRYSALKFGDGPTAAPRITYREGNVRFAGNSRGAGILVVNGDLTVTGTFRFDGVVIVMGQIKQSAGTANIYGSVIHGGTGSLFDVRGNFSLHYSSQAIALANSMGGQYVAFNGWQELSR